MRIIILDSGGAASHSATSAVSFALLSGCVQVASTYPGSVHPCNEMSSKAIRCHQEPRGPYFNRQRASSQFATIRGNQMHSMALHSNQDARNGAP